MFRNPKLNVDGYRTSLKDFCSLLRWKPEPWQVKVLLTAQPVPQRLGFLAPDDGMGDFEVECAIALWRTFCWPSSQSLYVAPSKAIGGAWIEFCKAMLKHATINLKSNFYLDDRVNFVNHSSSKAPNIIAVTVQELDTDMGYNWSGDPLTIIIPSVDRIPGCYLRSAAKLIDLMPGSMLMVCQHSPKLNTPKNEEICQEQNGTGHGFQETS